MSKEKEKILWFLFVLLLLLSFLYWFGNPRIYTFSYNREEVIDYKKYCYDNDMELYIGTNALNRIVILRCKNKSKL